MDDLHIDAMERDAQDHVADGVRVEFMRDVLALIAEARAARAAEQRGAGRMARAMVAALYWRAGEAECDAMQVEERGLPSIACRVQADALARAAGVAYSLAWHINATAGGARDR